MGTRASVISICKAQLLQKRRARGPRSPRASSRPAPSPSARPSRPLPARPAGAAGPPQLPPRPEGPRAPRWPPPQGDPLASVPGLCPATGASPTASARPLGRWSRGPRAWPPRLPRVPGLRRPAPPREAWPRAHSGLGRAQRAQLPARSPPP
jgi:hypothetical protein